ncbi:MAG TPA: hypothetical protein VMT10_12550 [Solirubrobacteraceae bacterium]|nr:hypothetical protein [Solirubrobacteraceae bacterium]
MFAVIRRYRTDGDTDATIDRTDHVYASAVEKQVGFVDYQIVRTSDGEIMTVILFDTEEEADRNRYFTEEFVRVGLAGLDVELLDEWRGIVEVSTASELALQRISSSSPEDGGADPEE